MKSALDEERNAAPTGEEAATTARRVLGPIQSERARHGRALSSQRRVIVRLPAWLGDCVMAEPVVRALLATHEQVTLVGAQRFADLFGTTHAHFLALERGSDPHVDDWRGHDVAVLLDGSWRGAFAALRAGIPERIGFASGARSLVLTTALTPALERGLSPLGIGRVGGGARVLPRPFGSACVELAALAGLCVIDREPRISVSAEIDARVGARLRLHGISASNPGIFVHAGARNASAKAIPIETLIAIVHALCSRGSSPIVLVCAPGEEAHARAVAARCPGVALLADPALGILETIAAHRFARVALVADGGSRHLATAAHRVPLVVVHGPTDPRHTADHRSSVRIARVDVDCGPCHEELCRIKSEGKDLCMREIDAARVADLAFELASGSQ